MGNFKINKAGMRKLEREIQQHVDKSVGGGVKVPLSGPEADAVRDVTGQLRKAGFKGNLAAEARRIVREVRANQANR